MQTSKPSNSWTRFWHLTFLNLHHLPAKNTNMPSRLLVRPLPRNIPVHAEQQYGNLLLENRFYASRVSLSMPHSSVQPTHSQVLTCLTQATSALARMISSQMETSTTNTLLVSSSRPSKPMPRSTLISVPLPLLRSSFCETLKPWQKPYPHLNDSAGLKPSTRK